MPRSLFFAFSVLLVLSVPSHSRPCSSAFDKNFAKRRAAERSAEKAFFKELPHLKNPTTPQMLETLLEVHLRAIEEKAIIDPENFSPSKKRRLKRQVALFLKKTSSFAKTAATRYPDVFVFQQIYRYFKLYVFYPFIFAHGYQWVPLVFGWNVFASETWVVTYFTIRQWMRSQLGRLWYGKSFGQMHRFHDILANSKLAHKTRIHELRTEEGTFELRTRSRVLGDFIWKLKKRYQSPDVMLMNELESMVNDPVFLYHASGLRTNPRLYEEVLIQKIMSNPTSRSQLIKRVAEMSEHPSQKTDYTPIIEITDQAQTLWVEYSSRLNQGLKRLGVKFPRLSRQGRSVRALSRPVRKRIAEEIKLLEKAFYKNLSSQLDGGKMSEGDKIGIELMRISIRQNLAEWHELITRVERAESLYDLQKGLGLLSETDNPVVRHK